MSTRSRRRKEETGTTKPVPAVVVPWLYRSAFWCFALFAFGMLVAFWPSYYSRLGAQESYHPHAHGIVMTLWVALLVAQAGLIRLGYRSLHRKLGMASYALVPVIVLATINFVHFRVRGAQELPPMALHFVALVLVALVAFLVLWGLGLYFRRKPATHARYMIATVFPLFTPVTDRLIGRFFREIVPMVPRIDGNAILPFAGFLLADVLLLGLAVWDWQANRRRDVFPLSLAVVLVFQVSVMTFHRVAAWKSFALWFAGLPLS